MGRSPGFFFWFRFGSVRFGSFRFVSFSFSFALEFCFFCFAGLCHSHSFCACARLMPALLASSYVTLVRERVVGVSECRIDEQTLTSEAKSQKRKRREEKRRGEMCMCSMYALAFDAWMSCNVCHGARSRSASEFCG